MRSTLNCLVDHNPGRSIDSSTRKDLFSSVSFILCVYVLKSANLHKSRAIQRRKEDAFRNQDR